jgi:hypothetical protein
MGKTGQKSTGMSMYQNLKKQVKSQQVKTDRTIPKSKHDIIIRDNERRNMYVNRCCNSRRQKCDKERSGEDSKIHLTVKIEHMWNVKTNVMPVITAAIGKISKYFIKYLTNVSGKHIKELQETALLGAAHTLRKVLMYKYKRFNIANSVICTMNSDYRIA